MKKIFLLALISFLFLQGCATSYLQESTNVSKQKKSYEKILIVSKTKDMTARLNGERQLVNDLKERGVKAESSIDLIKTDSFDKELTDKELDQLVQRLLAEGFQGVIVSNLIDASEYTDVIPGGMRTSYMPVHYGRFGAYYGAYPATYWEPDRVVKGIEYTLESAFYDITTRDKDNLQWVGRFKVRNPSNMMKAIAKYSEELANELIAQSINL